MFAGVTEPELQETKSVVDQIVTLKEDGGDDQDYAFQLFFSRHASGKSDSQSRRVVKAKAVTASCKRSLAISPLLAQSNARVRLGFLGPDGSSWDTVRITVEGDLVTLLDESALPDRLPERHPHVLVGAVVVRSQVSLEGLGGFPGVVVWDLGVDVVCDVRLSDAVQQVRANQGTHPLAVDGAESASREGPDVGGVVREEWVGVLKESDHDQPVVDANVWDTVVLHDSAKGSQVGGVGKGSDGEANTNVRRNNLHPVSLVKDDRVWVEVAGSLGVVELTRRVLDQVQRPAEELLNQQVHESVGRCVLEEFSEELSPAFSLLVNNGVGLAGETSVDLLLLIVRLGRHLLGGSQREQTLLCSGLGDKDLVASQVARRSVVTSVRDSPRVVRNEESRVQDPTDGVVEGLGLTGSLVASLVSTDPETSHDKSLPEPVHGPC